MISHKGSRACGHYKTTAGKTRWTFFWNDYDREANDLDAGLLLCARCWARYSGKKLGQETQMDRWDRLTDLKVAEATLSEGDSLRGCMSDWRVNDLSIVHLEDIAEDKPKPKSPKRPSKVTPAVFSLVYLAQLPPSARMGYVEAHPDEIAKLKAKDQDLVSTLLCEAASEELASDAPINSSLSL